MPEGTDGREEENGSTGNGDSETQVFVSNAHGFRVSIIAFLSVLLLCFATVLALILSLFGVSGVVHKVGERSTQAACYEQLDSNVNLSIIKFLNIITDQPRDQVKLEELKKELIKIEKQYNDIDKLCPKE